MTSSLDINFTDVTTAAILAGRGFSATRTMGSWQKLCKQLDRLAAELQLPLAVVIASDFSTAESDDEISAEARIGLLVAWNDGPQPALVDGDALRSAITRAAAVPWKKLAALIGANDSLDAPLEEQTALWVVPTGPLAGCHVAFGVLAADESQQLEWSPGSPQSREPKLEYVAGKDMEQKQSDEGVWGVSVVYTGDWAAEHLDLSAAKHQERTKALGCLASHAGYYLMASFD